MQGREIMNYEEMSNVEINKLMMGRNPKCVKFFRDVPSKDIVNGYDENGIHIETSDHCNNPADWGKLMEDNQISIKTMPDYLDVTIRGWEAVGSFGLVQQFYNSKSIGRAVSVCYLKIIGG